MQSSRKFRTLLLAVSLAPEEIGARLKEAREARGWSQLEFAMEAHVSPGTVYRWEKGQLPRVKELLRVAEILGVDADELVEPKPTRPPAADQLAALLEAGTENARRLDDLEAALSRIEALLRSASAGQ